MGLRKRIQFGLLVLCVSFKGAFTCPAQNLLSRAVSSVQEISYSSQGRSGLPLLQLSTGTLPTGDEAFASQGTLVFASADGQETYLPGSAGSDNTITVRRLSDPADATSAPSFAIELSTPADLLGAAGARCAVDLTVSAPACVKSRYFALLTVNGSESNLHSPATYTEVGIDQAATEPASGRDSGSAALRLSKLASTFVTVSWNGGDQRRTYRLVQLGDETEPDHDAAPQAVKGKAQAQAVRPQGATSGVSTVESLGSVLASHAAAGLGWNVTIENEWEFAKAAAAGATHVRMQCSWSSTESQSAPPSNTNTTTKFTLQPGCQTALGWTKKYGLHPTLVAAYGPPFHKILSLTTPSGAPAGATSIAVQFSSGVGGDTLASIKFPYDYLISSNGYSEISPYHSYAGTLITGITLTDSTHGLLKLASALNAALPASATTTYTVNEALYPSAATASPTDPSVIAFANYANYLATQIAAAGVTGEVELWNEPPWPDEAWDNRRDLYDTDPGIPGELGPGYPNWGFIAALQAYPPVPGVTYDWAGTNKSGDNSALAAGMLSTTGLAYTEPNAIVTFESLHPYGNNPEDAMWNEPCLQATIQPFPAPASPFWGCDAIAGSGSNMLKPQQLTLIEQSLNPTYGIGHSITETGFASSEGDEAHRARFIIRQFLGFQADGISFIEYYRLYDTSPENFGFFQQTVNADGTYTPTPAYTAIAGLISDIGTINRAPVSPVSASMLTSVSTYSGTYPIDIVHVVGSRAGDTVNSDLVAVWQRSYTATNPGWGTLASPTPAPVTLTLPTGLAAAAVINLDTRATVPFQVAGQQITFNVSDDPIEVLSEPIEQLTPTLNVTSQSISYGTANTTLQTEVSFTGSTAPTGPVTFSVDGSTSVSAACTGASSPLNCTATLPTSSLPVGTHTISAQIASSQVYTAAEATGSLTIVATTPALTFSSETISYGTASATLQATLSYAGSSAPNGGISFTLDSGAPIQAACSGTSSPLTCSSSVSSISLPAGVHAVAVVLASSTDYAAASASGTLTVAALTPVVTVTPAAVSYGATSITVQAKVSYSGPTAPTGSLSFSLDGGSGLPSTCTGASSPITCTAVIATVSLTAGSHTLTASEAASTDYTAASGSGTLTIGVLTPTVTVMSSNINYGTATATLQAQIAYTGSSSPTGNTSFAVDGGTPVAAVCTGATSPLTCTAQVATANLATGTHTVIATIGASTDYATASGAGSLAVGLLTPAIAVVPDSISYGASSTTLQAHIAYTGPSSPAGSSSFTLDGGTAVPANCTGSVSPLSCTATANTSNLAAGNHTVGFTVSASNGYGAASGSGTLTVAVLTPGIAVGPQSVNYGTASTALQAQISFTGPSAPTGAVSFSLDGGANKPAVCTGTGSPVTCTATVSTGALTAGTHTVVATVVASADYAGTSGSGVLTVGVLTPTLTVSPGSVNYGVSSVTLQAQVSFTGPSAPNGVFNFTLDGGSALAATCTGSSSPLTCTAQVSATNLVAGTHTVNAAMAAGTDYAAAFATGSLTVGLLTPAITVTSEAISYGTANTTLQAQVRYSGASAPNGALSFSLDGGVALPATCAGSSSPLTCTAIASTSNLAGGSHTIAAVLAASTNYTAANASATLSIGELTPGVAVVASSISYGTASTSLQASISYTGPTAPVGKLAFTIDGGSTLSATCIGSSSPLLCTALANTASLTAGAHTIAAALTADTHYTASSGSGTLSVGLLTPSLTLVSGSIAYGTATTSLQARVSYTGPIAPGGALHFAVDGEGSLLASCTGTTSPLSCTATATTASLAAGTHSIGATLNADANYAPASGSSNLTIIAIKPTLSVTSESVSYGAANTTLQAQVAFTGTSAPTGVLSFSVDGEAAVSASCSGSSSPLLCTALAPTDNLAAGTHTIAATLAASTNYAAATSTGSLNIGVLTPVISVTPGTISYGTSTTQLQAHVAYSGPIAPTGTVSFNVDGGSALPANCTGTASPLTCTTLAPTASLSAGTHTIAATLTAGGDYAAAAGSSSLTIGMLTPGITVAPVSIAYGASSTLLQAQVSFTGTAAPTGALTFALDGGPALPGNCTGTSSPLTCTVSASSANLVSGTHSIAVKLAGSLDYASAAASSTLKVGVLTPSVTVVPGSTSYGSISTNLQAHISYTGPTAPGGALHLAVDGGSSLLASCTGTTSPLSCIAAATTSTLNAGTHAVVATLGADANYGAASGTGTLIVGTLTPTLSVVPQSISYGSASTNVQAQLAYNGPSAPTGTISFSLDGGAPFAATCTVSNSPLSCTATLATASLAGGTHTIAATLVASANYAATSANASLNVGVLTPTLSLGSAQISYGTASTPLKALVTYAGPTAPTGILQFALDGGTALPFTCSGSSSPITCTASLSTASLAAGTHTLTATLAVSVDYAGATASSTLTVGKLAPTIAMSSGSISYDTASATVQAHLTYAGPTAPMGSFGFALDAGPSVPATCSGAASPLTCTAIIPTASLAVGSHAMIASLAASTDFDAATASSTLTVTADATLTAISASNATISLGQNETFTASVKTAPDAEPTGSVSFFRDKTLLATVPLVQGSATFTTNALPLGSDPVWAVYDGSQEFMPSLSDSPAQITVKNTDYTVTLLSSDTVSVAPGGSAEYKFLITPTANIYPGSVNVAVSGLPSNAGYSASPSSFGSNAGPQTVTLTVRTLPVSASYRPKLPAAVAPVLMGMFFLPLGAAVRRRDTLHRLRKGILPAFLLVIATVGVLCQTGCGAPIGNPLQTYTLSFNATAGTVQHSATVNLQMK